MSDSEKLRKTYGTLWIMLAFFLLAIDVSSIWLICVVVCSEPLVCLLFIGIFFFAFCFWNATITAYDYFVDVSKKEIDRSDKAKLLRINGLIYLTSSFITFSIAICFVWGMFLLWSEISVIFFFVIVFLTYCFACLINSAVCNFMAIKKLLEN